MLRKIVRIDEERCDGCGECVPSCAEGAIALVGGKARLSSDVLCDGLGACLGECPRGAIAVEEREAAPFDEEAVRAHLDSSERTGSRPQATGAGREAAPGSRLEPGAGVAPGLRLAVLSGAGPAPSGGCPGSRPMVLPRGAPTGPGAASGPAARSCLGQWPVQLHLVPVRAPYFQGADLLVAADCVPFAYAGFHPDLLAGRALVVGCPKLDDLGAYVEKLREIVAANGLRSVTVARMEVPCCGGIAVAARRAVEGAAPGTAFRDVVIGVDGQVR